MSKIKKLAMENWKKFAIAVLAVSLVTTLGLLINKSHPESNPSDKILVSASFYPLWEFASAVGGNKVEVINITPPGSEPHDFDLSPKDVVTLQKSDVFIYNSDGFEPWVEKIHQDLEGNGVLVINSSKGIDLISSSHEENQEDGHEIDENGENHRHDGVDPHIWIDPVLATKQIDNIKEALISVSPENSDYFTSNAKAYKQKLSDMDNNFRTGLGTCTKNTIVVSHNAFSYLAARYGFEIISISGLSPNEEPSPQKMSEIVDYARDNDLKHIFFETLVSPKLSKTIALEIGAKTLVLNPIEGLSADEIKAGSSYFTIQNKNLLNLMEALSCNE